MRMVTLICFELLVVDPITACERLRSRHLDCKEGRSEI
jgi:hypothetical protein